MSEQIIKACGERVNDFTKTCYFHQENQVRNNYSIYNHFTWEMVLNRVLSRDVLSYPTTQKLFGLASQIVHACKIARPKNVLQLKVQTEVLNAVELDVSKMRLSIYVVFYCLCIAFNVDPFSIKIPSHYNSIRDRLFMLNTCGYGQILLSKILMAHSQLCEDINLFPGESQYFLLPHSQDVNGKSLAKAFAEFLQKHNVMSNNTDIVSFYLALFTSSINIGFLLHHTKKDNESTVDTFDDCVAFSTQEHDSKNIHTYISSIGASPVIGHIYQNKNTIYMSLHNDGFVSVGPYTVTVGYSNVTEKVISCNNNLGLMVENDKVKKLLSLSKKWGERGWLSNRQDILNKMLTRMGEFFP